MAFEILKILLVFLIVWVLTTPAKREPEYHYEWSEKYKGCQEGLLGNACCDVVRTDE